MKCKVCTSEKQLFRHFLLSDVQNCSKMQNLKWSAQPFRRFVLIGRPKQWRNANFEQCKFSVEIVVSIARNVRFVAPCTVHVQAKSYYHLPGFLLCTCRHTAHTGIQDLTRQTERTRPSWIPLLFAQNLSFQLLKNNSNFCCFFAG